MPEGLSIWINGLPGSGKTTLAKALKSRLHNNPAPVKLLDGDELRRSISKDLGFSEADRLEQIRRAAEINRLFLDEGFVVINAFITPLHKMRLLVKAILQAATVFEVALTTPLEVCKARDPKGLYQQAGRQLISGMTGIDAPFEPSTTANIRIDTSVTGVEEAIELIAEQLKNTFN